MSSVATPVDNSLARPIEPVSNEERLRDELELIAYVTSHDLQAPLRTIQHCCGELSQASLPSSARQSVQALTAESDRMKLLMQGMLDYIRLETFRATPTQLDANEIVTAAVTALDPQIKAAGGTVTCDLLPQVRGHRGRLTRLFMHLIDNALKFRSDNAPRVHISARRIGEDWQFCVEDNGIGVANEHQYIIFTLFQRLHTAEAYPGHGIGLALARKIVEAHDGRLWVESAPGRQGSRFYFTLKA